MILDGWGIAKDPSVSAIDRAKTQFIDSLYNNYASAKLISFGEKVGLPKGQMGNSEVGHINLGAGRIVNQELAKINLAFKENSIQDQINLKNCLKIVKKTNKKLHLIGLLSDGGVHSHINHLEGLLDICEKMGIKNIYIHAFTDGRDVDPKSGLNYIKRIENKIKNTGAKMATVIGRYFSMDRDNRWERIKKTYDLLTKGVGKKTNDIKNTIKKFYDNGITDEFIEPIIITDQNGCSDGIIENEDHVIFFNFRTDRGRQLTKVLTQKDYPNFEMKKLKLNFLTMTNYDESFKGINVIYDSENIKDTLGEVLEKNNKTQIRIAETEKYPHVTFFLNGGIENSEKGESRIMPASPKVLTYDLAPEMSSELVTESLIKAIKNNIELIVVNYANPDMVGHTGDLQAAIKACEAIDKALNQVVPALEDKGGCMLLTSDHGNCETMINHDTNIPHTAHTTNLVPAILIGSKKNLRQGGRLADIAPTILELMQLPQPIEMTGKSLLC